jgi:hypothetical protein
MSAPKFLVWDEGEVKTVENVNGLEQNAVIAALAFDEAKKETRLYAPSPDATTSKFIIGGKMFGDDPGAKSRAAFDVFHRLNIDKLVYPRDEIGSHFIMIGKWKKIMEKIESMMSEFVTNVEGMNPRDKSLVDMFKIWIKPRYTAYDTFIESLRTTAKNFIEKNKSTHFCLILEDSWDHPSVFTALLIWDIIKSNVHSVISIPKKEDEYHLFVQDTVFHNREFLFCSDVVTSKSDGPSLIDSILKMKRASFLSLPVKFHGIVPYLSQRVINQSPYNDQNLCSWYTHTLMKDFEEMYEETFNDFFPRESKVAMELDSLAKYLSLKRGLKTCLFYFDHDAMLLGENSFFELISGGLEVEIDGKEVELERAIATLGSASFLYMRRTEYTAIFLKKNGTQVRAPIKHLNDVLAGRRTTWSD